MDKRKSSRRSSEDFSPPRKRMYDEKVIFKKEKIDDDFSPPRRRTEVMSKKVSSPKISKKSTFCFVNPLIETNFTITAAKR